MSASNTQFTSLSEIDNVRKHTDFFITIHSSLSLPSPQIHNRLSQTWKSGVTRKLDYRRRQLLQLARMIQENHLAVEEALFADLGKQRLECGAVEMSPLVHGALHAVENLEEWASPEKPTLEAWRANWDATVYPVPKGIALIISSVHLYRQITT
jgi:acyl-CoA reductase-like NAD-dependent aldehyde dehydrogenase